MGEVSNAIQQRVSHIVERLHASDFQPAHDVEYIPVEGLAPRGKGWLDLSVSRVEDVSNHSHIAPGSLASERPEDLIFRGATSLLLVQSNLVGTVALNEALQKGHLEEVILPFVAFAPNTDSLQEQFLNPTIQLWAKKTGRKKVLIDVGYPLIRWYRSGLENAGLSIVEPTPLGPSERQNLRKVDEEGVWTRLQAWIKQGKRLPDDIGICYLDYPSTVFGRAYSRQELVDFIRNNPHVLFVIDETNLYFEKHLSKMIRAARGAGLPAQYLIFPHSEFDYRYFSSLSYRAYEEYNSLGSPRKLGPTHVPKDAMVIVTHTTSKATGFRGCAFGQATERATTFLKEHGQNLPRFVGFRDTPALRGAAEALRIDSANKNSYWIEDYGNHIATVHGSFDRDDRYVKLLVAENRERFAEMLIQKVYGLERTIKSEKKIFPFGYQHSPHIILDARELDFQNAEALQQYLESKKIMVKTLKYYGDLSQCPELANFIYISVSPEWTDMQKLFDALSARIETSVTLPKN